jgi:hypothetical protein
VYLVQGTDFWVSGLQGEDIAIHARGARGEQAIVVAGMDLLKFFCIALGLDMVTAVEVVEEFGLG